MRDIVLHLEQGFDRVAIQDGLDDDAIHLGVFQDGCLVGSCRLIQIDKTAMKLGRMVVLRKYRNKGIGGQIISFIIDEFLHAGKISCICLEAQIQAGDFYSKFEFEYASDTYLVCNFPHRKMVLGEVW